VLAVKKVELDQNGDHFVCIADDQRPEKIVPGTDKRRQREDRNA
jgi:hypothetical protein